MRNLSRQSQNGITLIEVIVVVAIVGILISIAAPSFVTTTQKFRILEKASSFVGALQFARAEAIKEGAPVTICASSDGATCLNVNTWQKGWIIFSDPLANKTVGTILKKQKSWTSTDTMLADNSVSSVTFSRDGFAIALPVTAGTGMVTFTLHSTPINTNATRCISLNKIGRQETQIAGTGACT